MRTCPPDGKARKVLTAMTNHVVHLADTLHVAYKGVRVPYGRKKSDKVIETVKDGKEVEVQVNPKSSRRRRKETSSPPAIDIAATELVGEGQYERRDAKTGEEDSLAEFDQASMLEKPAEEPFRRPGEGGYPTSNVFLNTPEFVFNNNVTSLSHETLCSDSSMHDTQGQFCSDFRSLESLYPVFSPSTMPGFSDVVIPSRECFDSYLRPLSDDLRTYRLLCQYRREISPWSTPERREPRCAGSRDRQMAYRDVSRASACLGDAEEPDVLARIYYRRRQQPRWASAHVPAASLRPARDGRLGRPERRAPPRCEQLERAHVRRAPEQGPQRAEYGRRFH